MIDRVLSRGTDLELQVSVSPVGGEPVEGKKSTFTDGVNEWFSFRIPKATAKGMLWDDFTLRFNLAKHVESIGASGWDWKSNVARWVGFDFDSSTSHATSGIDDAQLTTIVSALSKLPYVEIRKSTSGSGLHAYVFLDAPCHSRKQLGEYGRRVLAQMSDDCGLDLSKDIDKVGQNMWIASRRATIENGGLSLIKPATETFELPASCIPREPQPTSTVEVKDDGIYSQLTRAFRQVPLDEQHIRVRDRLTELGCAEWDNDKHMLRTHTRLLKQVHGELNLSGPFETLSPGTDLKKSNCWGVPLDNGAWRFCLFGGKEADTWTHTPTSVWCFYNYGDDERIDFVGKTFSVTAANKLATGTELQLSTGGTVLVPYDRCKSSVFKDANGKVEPKSKLLQALTSRANAERFGASLTARSPQRLADEISSRGSFVNFGGALFAYDTTGFVTVDNPNSLMASHIKAITQSDVDFFLYSRGIQTQQIDVTTSTCRDALNCLHAMLPKPKAWNTDLKGAVDLRHSVNYSNGIWLPSVDELIPHSPNYFVKRDIGIPFDRDAKCDRWMRFLNEVLPEQVQQVSLQETVGCIMAGDHRHHKLTMLIGKTRGGKGTTRDIIAALVGQSAHTINPNDLTSPFGMAGCLDKRLIVINEAKDCNQQQVAKIKQVTGGDPVSIGIKYQAGYQGYIDAAWLLLSNDHIVLPDDSGAIVGRMNPFMFRVSFLGREDYTLYDALMDELPGIARWAREGYLRVLANGRMTENTEAHELKQTNVEIGSPVMYFVQQRCKLVKGKHVGRNTLYAKYIEFNEGEPLSSKAFAMALKSAYPSILSTDQKTMIDGERQRSWEGIQLLPQ